MRVLIFSPHHSCSGGVINFLQVFERNLSAGFMVETFIVGQRPNATGILTRYLTPLLDAARLVKLLLFRKHDVYHINPSLAGRSVLRDGLFVLILRIFRRQNVLVFFHGWNNAYFDRIVNNQVSRSLFRIAFGHAAILLVLASSFARGLEGLGIQPARIRVVTTMFDGRPMQSVSRHRANDNGIRILFLSRFVAEKGVFELLAAFKRITERGADATLIMAGAGPALASAEGWCKKQSLDERVRFLGHVEGARKAQLLVDADLFVLPSSHGEGCPVALLEAMGAGLPVVVTPVGGISDIVHHRINGLVIDTPDADSIAGALTELVGDEDLRVSMGRVNREVAWQKYEARIVTCDLEREYNRMVLPAN